MENIRNAPSLLHEMGKYTVDALSIRDLTAFEAFQLSTPDNPMKYEIPNRDRIRGKR